MKAKRIIQFSGKEIILGELEQKVKEIWRESGNLQKDIKSMEIYVKIEENKCYYVVNETVSGKFELIA
ncbi:DUF6465 family protein [Clostridium sp.]|uniref:DUF6465 family protein n=1 Tax=Clostridium sp. TaxID=1506 RepID=UPI003D6CCCC4